MIFDLYSIVSNFAVKVAHNLIGSFSDVSTSCVACVCNDYHRTNRNCRSMMGLTSNLFCVYDIFSSYCVSFSSMASLTMMVLGPGSPPVCNFPNFLNYPLIVLVDFHIMESPNPFVVSVEYFQCPAQKLL